ncbi:putative ATPase [Aquabacter spiritensis]|uniref:Putative ATPase n=2 Tax=Aquabacter spiritensis TaxID=933073 RepID=A0A4R3LY91_9HYPH|nr:putative ATPase [Aquabacter spiritensis]
MIASCPLPDKNIYVFGPYRLAPNRQLLSRNGLPVRLGGRALDILIRLVQRAGEIISKNELIAFVWPNTFVHEDNLKVNVSALRRALGAGAASAYIATIAGRGYRFVAPVTIEPTEHASSSWPASAYAQTLPKAPLTIGRDGDISRIAGRLAGARCVTIVGSGGIGKTSVAIAVGHRVRNYSDGVLFVDLSTVGDPQNAPAAIAAALDAEQNSFREIIDCLKGRNVLLIFDGCEHLLPTMTTIADHLLDALPMLSLLATSREPLRARSELVHRLPTLETPWTKPDITAREALDFGAVQLFIARAQEHGFYVLDDRDAPLVSSICRRLDGIPLAINLAASKVRVFGIPTLAAMLGQRFLLINGERTAPMRQQTLFSTLDWSYRLLSDAEAALFRILAVFAGVFHLQDAVVMAEIAELDASQTIDALERLTQRSIVCAEYRGGALNYRLLETTREYATKQLADVGEQDRAVKHHARHILSPFKRPTEDCMA